MTCPKCGFRHHCLCDDFPLLKTDIELILLSHPNELPRVTNTGKLLLRSMPNTQVFTWSRTEPPASLLNQLQAHSNPVLLFPSMQSEALNPNKSSLDKAEPALYVILDATWQEAKKMWRQSPWLQQLHQVHLENTNESLYSLRRNQNSGNLCTFEVGVELIRAHGDETEANKMADFLEYYLNVFQADKSGHQLK
jgi:DTW domain-containing protein YfiP